MKKTLSRIFTQVMTLMLVFCVFAGPVYAVDTITKISSFGQSPSGGTYTAVPGATTNNVSFFYANCASSNTATGVTYGGQAFTKIDSLVQGGSDPEPNAEISLWYLVNPPTGSNTFAGTCSGAGTLRIQGITFSGVSQTTPYNPAALAKIVYLSSEPHSLGVTTQYDNSWLVGAMVISGAGNPTGDSNTTFPHPNSYNTPYTPTAQTPPGAHAIGYTNSEISAWIVTEVVPSGAVIDSGNGWETGYDF